MSIVTTFRMSLHLAKYVLVKHNSRSSLLVEYGAVVLLLLCIAAGFAAVITNRISFYFISVHFTSISAVQFNSVLMLMFCISIEFNKM